jgi:hypothetical protein
MRSILKKLQNKNFIIILKPRFLLYCFQFGLFLIFPFEYSKNKYAPAQPVISLAVSKKADTKWNISTFCGTTPEKVELFHFF